MSKKIKIFIAVSAGVMAALVAAFCIAYFALQIPLFDRSGWSTLENSRACYRDYYGRPITGWQELDGAKYYFLPDGAMHTGWIKEGDNVYYFAKDGKLYSGALEDFGNRYYILEDGTPHTGWLTDGESKAYYNQKGILQTGWLEQPEGTYLLDENGVPRTGWVEVDGIRYYIEPTGLLNKNWQDIGGKLRYCLIAGTPHTGWLEVPEGTYYFDENGNQQTGWITDARGRFYLYEDGTFATGFVTINGIERYFASTGEYILLCNRWNYVPDDYEMNLVKYKSFKIDASCYDDFVAMVAAAKKDGVTIKINNSYRSRKRQEEMWEERRVKYMGQGMTLEQANDHIGRSVAVPGTSEHQTGLAMDIYGSKATKWLAKNSWKYGFILRYPDNKRDITGIIYEPWHFRYVGKSFAKEIYDSGLCLEEYLTQLKTNTAS